MQMRIEPSTRGLVTRRFHGILLAAGSSIRYGDDKLLVPLPDGTPIAIAAARHLISVLPESVAVVAGETGELASQLREAGLRIVVNERAKDGIGTSLARAVSATARADGWVVALADMPFIQPATIRQVVATLERGAELAAPSYGGRLGHPVGFASRFRSSLSRLEGDRGGRMLLAQHAEALVRIETDDAGAVTDIDTPADLTAALTRHGIGGAS